MPIVLVSTSFIIGSATTLSSSSDLQCSCFDKSLLVGQLKVLLTECLDDFNRHRKISNRAIQNKGFLLNAGPRIITMETKKSILPVNNYYATNNSYKIATNEQHDMGDPMSYKESTMI